MKVVNPSDEYLLGNDFNRLLIRKQQKIRNILSVGIRKGFFCPDELEDAIQETNKRLLEKAGHLRDNYNGLSTVDAYLQTIIYHECCRYARTAGNPANRNCKPDEHAGMIADNTISSVDRLIIRDEVKRLEAVFRLYPSQKFRLVVWIKILCRFPLEEADIRLAYPETDTAVCRDIVKTINQALHNSDIELFRMLSLFLDAGGQVKAKPGSLLHQAKEKIKQMIVLLNNSSHAGSAYDMKSFLLLAERFFSMRKNMDVINFVMVSGYILSGLNLFNYM